MYNIKLIIEYDGTRYCGWQRQKTKRTPSDRKKQKPSIQEIIELCLKKILKQKIHLIASGRTDSGVHALGQVANFKSIVKIEPKKIKLALNGNLPKDIRIVKARFVSLGFHSRFSAKSKIYRYLIQNQDYKSSFFKGYSYWFKLLLKIKLMRRTSRHLLGRHDFSVFCASGSGRRNFIRTIRRISISNLRFFSCNLICIEIEADGFLYNMVRNIVGTLIEVGRARFKPDYVKEILKRKDRSLSGPCVPAKGLFLIKVKY